MNDDKRKWHTELTSLVAGRLVERINVAGIELKGSRNIKKKKRGGQEIFGKFYENKDSWNNLYLSAIVAILLQFYHSLSQLCDKEMFKKKIGRKVGGRACHSPAAVQL